MPWTLFCLLFLLLVKCIKFNIFMTHLKQKKYIRNSINPKYQPMRIKNKPCPTLLLRL